MIGRARYGYWIALALALPAGAFVLFFEPVRQAVDLPPTGEAAINPMYALKRGLQLQGVEVASRPSFRFDEMRPGPRDTIVLRRQPDALGEEAVGAVLDWVESGGHLVLPGPEAGEAAPLARALGLLPDEPEADGDADSDADGEGDAVADDDAAPSPAVRCASLRPSAGGAGGGPSMLCAPPFLAQGDWNRFGEDAAGRVRFVRGQLGEGLVTAGDLGVLDNAALRAPAAREVARVLLLPRLGEGRVHLVYSSRIAAWWALLLRHGWPVLVPAALALLAWVAWRGQRLGPVRRPADVERRALLEHVRAAGQFAFRLGHGGALYAAAARLFRARLAQRRPALAALQGEAQVQALAEALGMDVHRVRVALAPVGLQRPDTFLHSISGLFEMRNRL